MTDKNNYSVYTHKVVTDDKGPMWYVGVTNNIKERWKPNLYKGTSLEPYIKQYGWDNIEHRIVSDGLDYETAAMFEDALIRLYRIGKLCINKQRSGLIKSRNRKDYRRVYYRKYRKDNKESLKEYNKKYYSKWCEENKGKRRLYNKKIKSRPETKIYDRVRSYNTRHTPIETPLEAKMKYLESGYIPSYIKNDDIG